MATKVSLHTLLLKTKSSPLYNENHRAFTSSLYHCFNGTIQTEERYDDNDELKDFNTFDSFDIQEYIDDLENGREDFLELNPKALEILKIVLPDTK